ncbi:MAG: hypothetical protein J6K89_07015 [Oscillospiraceae bacterium]|nr:hypothetical protein [Oscillospiraceae bacterium]
MFQIGETVLYELWGVCTIECMETQKSTEGVQEYLVLRPVYHDTAKLYLPNKQACLEKVLRYVLDRDQIRELLQDLTKEPLQWVEDPKERSRQFRQILSEGDRGQLLRLIRLLYLRRKELREKGRNLRMTDDQALRDAEKLLNGEFAYVLGIPLQEVPNYIHAYMDALEE